MVSTGAGFWVAGQSTVVRTGETRDEGGEGGSVG